MEHSKGKMRFLAVKLSALQSELNVSKQIFQQASKEVDAMFIKKYFPETPAKQKKTKPSVPVHKQEQNENSNADNQSASSEKIHDTNQNNKQNDTIIEKENKSVDPEVKSIFRKIAFKIHPDKLINLSDGFEKDKKQQLYSKAVQAMENNDLIILADIALELGLEPPEISEERLKATEQKINTIKKELKHIESTVVWQWFFCIDQEQKDKILDKLFKLMYEKNYRP